jgi:hypothetical protein
MVLLSTLNFVALQYSTFKGAQVWDFDLLDFNDFFIMKSM